jgi:putative ABC transport system permease protein
MVSSRLLVRKTLRDLRASRAQTIALTAIVALGVTVFLAAIGAYRDLATSEAATYDRLRLADAWFQLNPSSHTLVEEVAARPGIAAVEGRLVVDTGLQIGDDRVRGRLIGSQVVQPATVNDVAVIAGDRPARPGNAMIERTFAEQRSVEPGHTVTAIIGGQPTPLYVAATVATPEYIQVTPDRYEILPAPSSFAVVFVDLGQLQGLTDNAGQINNLVVRVDADADPDVVLGELEADLRTSAGLLDAVRRADQASYAALEQDLGTFRAVAIAMPIIILLAGMATTSVLLGRVVRAQRPSIGVMKALGYRDRTVLGHYLAYAAILGVIGAAVGVAAGTILGGVVTRAYTGQIGVPFTTSRFHPGLAAAAITASMVAVTVAAWRPARRSARMAPALATRVDFTGLDRPGRRSRLERLVPLPMSARVPLRAVGRAPGRAAGTVGGIAAAILLLIMVLSLRDAMNLFLTRAFDDLERWDVSVMLDEPRDVASLSTIEDTPGVTEASPFLQGPARLQAGDHRQDVLLTALAPDQDLRRLPLGEANPAEALAAGRIVITGGLAENLGVEVDDALTVTTAAGSKQLTVSDISDEPMLTRAYIGLATAAAFGAAGGQPLANGIYLRVEDDPAAVRSRIYDYQGVAAVAIRDEQRADLRSLLNVFDALLAVMLAFSAAMAFAVLVNAMTINVLEREREYATMRALGARPGVIAKFLAVETTLLWTIALAPGLLAGAWIATLLGDAIAADLFVLEVRGTPNSYLVAGGGVLAISLLSLLLPMRRIRRTNLAAATKTLG